MQDDVADRIPEDDKTTPAHAPLISGRRATMAMQIYRLLRREIMQGHYKPLHSLSESVLAATYGVSRTPVREAFGKLEEEGLVAILPQYGTFVAPIRIDRVSGDHFVREALECAAVRRAAERCTQADAATLHAIIATQRSATTNDEAFFEADEEMHRALMALSGHADAWHVVNAAKVNVDRIRLLSVRQMFKRQSTLNEHERIIDAVVTGRADEAAAAMRDHLLGVFDSSQRMMAAHPEFFQATSGDPRPARRRRTPA